jgi:predicted RNA-binding Zn-ribbon protein involved in translation (DUF1610 family)
MDTGRNSRSAASERAQPEDLGTPRTSHRRSSRHSRFRRILARAWSEWRVEILIGLMVAVAIFLLVERMQIRQTLLGWLRQAVQAVGQVAGGLLRGLVDFVRNTTLSDLVGYALLLGALVFFLWRVRWRLMTAPRFTTRACPRCGNDLIRVHRHAADRLLNLFVPVRRYRCKDGSCGWSGLRVGTGHPD